MPRFLIVYIWGLRLNDMMNVEQIKKELRKQYAQKRADIPPREKTERDMKITQQLLESNFYVNAKEILCYVSTENEIDTTAIIEDAIKNGKSVFAPKCTGQKGIMKFYRIRSFDDLKSGKFGIMEPDSDKCEEWLRSGENALCVVPALCCDADGNRLGYGGGYYDRFLSSFDGFTVCLCYREFSQVDLPCEPYDVACKAVIKG